MAREIKKNGNVMAIIGPKQSIHMQTFQFLVATKQVPHILPFALDPALKADRFPWLVQTTRTYDDQIRAVLALVSSLGWTGLEILVGEEENYRRVAQRFTQTKRRIEIIGVRIIKTSPSNIKEQLQAVKKSGKRIILLLCGINLVVPLLQEADNCQMLSYGWQWIIWDDTMNSLKIDAPLTNQLQNTLSNYSGLLGIRMRLNLHPNFAQYLQTCNNNSFAELNVVEASYAYSMMAFAHGFKMLLETFNDSVTTPSVNSTSWTFGRSLLNFIQSYVNQTQEVGNDTGTLENDTVHLLDVMNLQNKTWKLVGSWSPYRNLTLNRDMIRLIGNASSVSRRDPDFKFHTLKIITIDSPPFTSVSRTYRMEGQDLKIDDTAKFSGYGFELLRALKKELKFNYTIEVLSSEMIGIRDSFNGRWSGLVGELVAGRADLALAPITITSERAKFIDFGPVLFQTSLKYLVDTQSAGGILSGYNRFAFLLPFQWTLWAGIAVTAFMVACYLALASHLSPYGAHGSYFQSDEAEEATIQHELRRSSVMSIVSRQSSTALLRRRSSAFSTVEKQRFQEREGSRQNALIVLPSKTKGNETDDDLDEAEGKRNRAQRQMSFSNALYFSFAALLWQSPESVPRAPSGRAVAAIWYMVGVTFVASYTANMVTFVTQTTTSSHLLHAHELAQQSVVLPGTISNSLINNVLTSSSFPIAEKLYEVMLRDPKTSLLDGKVHALQKVLAGKIAFIWDSAFLDHISELSSDCRLRSVSLGFGQFSNSIALRKNSPYTKSISKKIEDFRENGYLNSLKAEYYDQPLRCDDFNADIEKESYVSLTYASLAGVFDMLTGAAIISIVVVALEWLVAACSDIDYTDPKKPSNVKRALQIRWGRLVYDAKENWLPFRKCRKLLSKKLRKRKCQKVTPKGEIEPDQWKRYTSSDNARNLRPGQSISEPTVGECKDSSVVLYPDFMN
ncbi:unnamed protein product [Clavelina lepadiformis]|uniref:Uncharacterized protein n=1 Tax=Clavelina lepadiformis TaxID=159417 RepID=A0ABP0GG19_CLALP